MKVNYTLNLDKHQKSLDELKSKEKQRLETHLGRKLTDKEFMDIKYLTMKRRK